MVEASVCKTDLSGFESRRYLQFIPDSPRNDKVDYFRIADQPPSDMGL